MTYGTRATEYQCSTRLLVTHVWQGSMASSSPLRRSDRVGTVRARFLPVTYATSSMSMELELSLTALSTLAFSLVG
ncbi:unnamed protein product [Parajaminaea phylloscopi]